VLCPNQCGVQIGEHERLLTPHRFHDPLAVRTGYGIAVVVGPGPGVCQLVPEGSFEL
jgi:hypothetical protein